MQELINDIKHYYQPTNSSCGHASLAMLLSHYGDIDTPEDVINACPVNLDEEGNEKGSVSQELATLLLHRDYDVKLTTFDFQIIDLYWAGLSQSDILNRLEAVKDVRNVKSIGKIESKRYVNAYVEFLKAGGEIAIQPVPKSQMLRDMLKDGPVFLNVSAHPLYNEGRLSYGDVRETTPDDMHGYISTHSVVLYGYNSAGNFLLADPWEGLTVVEPETLLSAITAAQIECDNMCFQISKKS
ncbi:MAG: hypothetical protein V4611_04530 [Patescibacteria group bacterium]